MGALESKVAIITGANSGVGAATAKLFAKEGAKIVICARREGPLNEVAGEIRAEGGEVLAIPADISKREDADKLIAAAVENYGQLDVLINNAGVLEKGLKPVDRCTDEEIDMVLDINTKGTMYMTRAASAEMAKRGYGSIVNIDSVAGVFGCSGAAYSMSKAAINGITKHTALRFAGTGIRCNSICPSTIVTPMAMTIDPATLDVDMITQMGKHSDLQIQPCMPEDVANIALFLASDASRAITGQLIVSDFGSTL